VERPFSLVLQEDPRGHPTFWGELFGKPKEKGGTSIRKNGGNRENTGARGMARIGFAGVCGLTFGVLRRGGFKCVGGSGLGLSKGSDRGKVPISELEGETSLVDQ